jgi:hypothetical protein
MGTPTRTAESCNLSKPGRLWSLWDMQNFLATDFLWISREIGRLSSYLTSDNADEVRSPAEQVANDKQVVGDWRKKFDELGLHFCARQCGRTLNMLNEDKEYTHRELSEKLVELCNRMEDEMASNYCIMLSREEKQLYEPDAPIFGIDVGSKFPDLAEDISEAAKCLALKRATAAVFHLMRVMEAGVQKFGATLGVSLVNEPVWQVILDGVNSKIKALPKGKDAVKKAEVASNLYNVKLAWRNETMHPKATYTDEEADNIFRAVKAFVHELAAVV